MCFLHHSKNTLGMVLCAKGIVSGLFLGAGGVRAVPYDAILVASFCFQNKVMKPAFITYQSAVKKVITFNNIPFHSCERMFLC
jgi:hypothetical protein